MARLMKQSTMNGGFFAMFDCQMVCTAKHEEYQFVFEA
jgi:hypothetical protein